MKFLLPLAFVLAFAVHFNAQKKSELADCRQIVIDESINRRGFDERAPVSMDLDGDGEADLISSRTYALKTKPKAADKRRENHWIAFDLKTSRGRTLDSFFKYQYGTDEADYWVYALIPCRLNQDARIDLVFYTGDDTSDETIILENTGKSFKVHSKKTDLYD